MNTVQRQQRCPQCSQPIGARHEFRPFCSQRCKLLDLGQWLDGSHHIPGPELEDESLREVSPGGDPANEDEPGP